MKKKYIFRYAFALMMIIAPVSAQAVSTVPWVRNGTFEYPNYIGDTIGIGQLNPTAKLDILDTTLAGSGSLAGSALNIAQTWNTSGSPSAILLNVTNTASGASSQLLNLQVGGSSKLTVDTNGALVAGNGVTLNQSNAGNISIPAASVYLFAGRSRISAPASAQFDLADNGNSTGIGFDVTTDSTLKIRNRAQNADGNLTAGNALFSGYVGIGTTTPTASLSLGNGVNAASTTASGGINFGDPKTNLYRSAANNLATDMTSLNFTVGAAGTINGVNNYIASSFSTASLIGEISTQPVYGWRAMNGGPQTGTTGTTGAFQIGTTNTQFNPQTGTQNFNNLDVASSFNQGGSASGTTRAMLIDPLTVLTSVFDYRNLEIGAMNETLSTSSNITTGLNTVINPVTYGTASTSVVTLANAYTVNITGAPIASSTGSVKIATSTALNVVGGTLNASTTEAYGLQVTAPTGAGTNYAEVVNGLTVNKGAKGTLTSCGTNPSLGAGSNDMNGVMYMGTGIGVNSCAYSWAIPHPSASVAANMCSITQMTGTFNNAEFATSSTGFVINGSNMASLVFGYNCGTSEN